MQIIAPDILEDARQLSVPIHATALFVGFLLWSLGWTGHRFWIVLVVTMGAGIFGLYAGPAYGLQPWLAAGLLAVVAGLLALALARIVAFAAGGAAGLMLLPTMPANFQEQPLVAFFVCGLIGLLLFRLWTMVLTSAAGTLLMMYSGLCLAQRFGTVDIMALAEAQAPLLNSACGVIAFVGLFAQFTIDRRRRYDPVGPSEVWSNGSDLVFGRQRSLGRMFRRVG